MCSPALSLPSWHELWDYAELTGKRTLDKQEIDLVVQRIIAGQSDYYERLGQRLSMRQRAVLQALAKRGSDGIYSQAVREDYPLALFVDPLFALWIKARS